MAGRYESPPIRPSQVEGVDREVQTLMLKFGFTACDSPPLPHVYLVVDEYWKDEDGFPRMSSQCATEGEIDWNIDAHIEALEHLRKRAKSGLRKAIGDSRKKPLFS